MNRAPTVARPHTDFRFHAQILQVGCYWGEGGHTELYLIEGAGYTLIDTGCAETPGAFVAPAMENLGRGLRDVSLVLNTHGHMDHAGGNAQVVAASGAPVWLPSPDVRVAEDPDYQFDTFFAVNHTLVGRDDRLAAARATLREQAGRPVKVSRALNDGDLIDLGHGVELRVIAAPGHTLGCACFYWEREGLLIAGDSVPAAGSRPGQLPLIYYPDEYERTLDRLETLDLNVLCLGHHYLPLTFPRSSLHFGRAGKQFIRESRQIARIIADAVSAAGATLAGAPFLAVARQATNLIERSLPSNLPTHPPLNRDSENGIVIGGIATIAAYLKRQEH